MGAVDLIIYAAGYGEINENLAWEAERRSVETNVMGFAAVANIALNYFIQNKSGHLVAISSLAALRGGKSSPAYNASKAFMSNYLEGLRQKVTNLGLPIIITDIKPGFVDTDMAKGEGLFWMSSAKKAARQIHGAIKQERSHVYVTKRWRLIAWLLQLMPSYLYNRL
jgi:short-subunit dehydrogenase